MADIQLYRPINLLKAFFITAAIAFPVSAQGDIAPVTSPPQTYNEAVAIAREGLCFSFGKTATCNPSQATDILTRIKLCQNLARAIGILNDSKTKVPLILESSLLECPSLDRNRKLGFEI